MKICILKNKLLRPDSENYVPPARYKRNSVKEKEMMMTVHTGGARFDLLRVDSVAKAATPQVPFSRMTPIHDYAVHWDAIDPKHVRSLSVRRSDQS